MKSYSLLLKTVFVPITILIISFLSTAEDTRQEFPQRNKSSITLNTIAAWILSFLVASVSSAGGIGGGSLFVPILTLVAGSLFLPITILIISFLSTAEETRQGFPQRNKSSISLNTIAAWILSFLVASVSSAGGIGGGSLFVPILTLVAGLNLKKATTFSAFMVTGGSLSTVLYILLFMSRDHRGHPLINYDIALLSQPCMLLGVSVGVFCNLVSPEWLITVFFSLFLAYCTYKTCKAGVKIWRAETEEHRTRDTQEGGAIHEPLLGEREEEGGGSRSFPLKDVLVLVTVWLCFFLLHVFVGDKHNKGVIGIQPCGVAYWLINLSQIPFALAFTSYILYVKRKPEVQGHQEGEGNSVKKKLEALPVYVFPLSALLTGIMSGLFGIGGGLLFNPILLQIGVPPQTAASTSSFMVMFSSSMSMVQYILVGMSEIEQALIYAIICFVASIVGLVITDRAVRESGRVSLIVFLVTAIMALSTVIITCSGAVDLWRQYTSGDYMGFKLPC